MSKTVPKGELKARDGGDGECRGKRCPLKVGYGNRSRVRNEKERKIYRKTRGKRWQYCFQNAAGRVDRRNLQE